MIEEDILELKTRMEKIINKRLEEFKRFSKADDNELFKELCFCILTANFDAKRAMAIQKEIGDGFIKWNKNKLAEKLKALGHRYPNTRADYIIKARRYKNDLKNIRGMDTKDARTWLVSNIKGIGYKEASHFLRNIGFQDVAIIDFHIIDVLERYGITKRPKTLTKVNYLKIEKKLRDIGKNVGLTPAALDLYLWYMETGKVLK